MMNRRERDALIVIILIVVVVVGIGLYGYLTGAWDQTSVD
jgi:Tfp pilus assembly protein PilO